MTTLLVGLADRMTRAVSRFLPEAAEDLVTARDADEGLRLAGACSIGVVLVGGPSIAVVTASCRQLRAAGICRDSVIVAAVHGGEQDVQDVLEAGADDFFVDSLADGSLRNRLFVARRLLAQRLSAQELASERSAGSGPRADPPAFFELCRDLLAVTGLDGYFKSVNQAWTRTLGWSTAELLAEPYLDSVHPRHSA